jgi:hypothetical protein
MALSNTMIPTGRTRQGCFDALTLACQSPILAVIARAGSLAPPQHLLRWRQMRRLIVTRLTTIDKGVRRG